MTSLVRRVSACDGGCEQIRKGVVVGFAREEKSRVVKSRWGTATVFVWVELILREKSKGEGGQRQDYGVDVNI